MKSVLKHVIDKIDKSEVQEDLDAYPYLAISEIFPQNYYDELVSTIKNLDKSVFRPLSKNYTDRDVYDLFRGESINSPKQDFKTLKPQEAKFLKEFQDTFLSSPEFKNAFFRKYQNHIDFPDYRVAAATCRIQRDYKGYSIGPHRDRLDKLFSVMIYTPTVEHENLTDELKLDHGTDICILNHNDPQTAPSVPGQIGTGAGRHFTFGEVSIAKTIPCEPNTLFSWAVAAKSFHGVTPLKSDKTRSTLAFFVKIPKQYTSYHKLFGNQDFKK